MTSTNGSDAKGSGAKSGGAGQATDPQTLVADIERTREELAETLELIVDRVSPKRVAQRTGDKVTHAVQEGLQSAREAAESLRGAAMDKVVAARNSAVQVPGSAVGGSAVGSSAGRSPVSGGLASGGSASGSVAVPASDTRSEPRGPGDQLPPTRPVEVPELGSGARSSLLSALPRGRTSASAAASNVPPQYVAAGAAGLALLLLLWRRRR